MRRADGTVSAETGRSVNRFRGGGTVRVEPAARVTFSPFPPTVVEIREGGVFDGTPKGSIVCGFLDGNQA